MIPEFFTPRPEWTPLVEGIIEAVGKSAILEEWAEWGLELRRESRADAVHSSTAIEGNDLSVEQVRAIAAGQPVHASRRMVQEVANALAAYEMIPDLNPWSVDDFLKAHRVLTAGLQPEAGEFRSIEVEIVNMYGESLHAGSSASKVPRLITELFEWGQSSDYHPLIVSSATHFLIEYIHPFRDGNGRMGRLWQALILSKWRETFEWLPLETMVKTQQRGYYQAFRDSEEPEVDGAPFIDFMLRAILSTLDHHMAQLERQRSNVGMSVGINVGIRQEILLALNANPALNAVELADRLGKTPRTIERHLAALKAAGVLRREGSRRDGHWVVGGKGRE